MIDHGGAWVLRVDPARGPQPGGQRDRLDRSGRDVGRRRHRRPEPAHPSRVLARYPGVVPTAYMILDDIGRTMRRIFGGREPEAGPAPSVSVPGRSAATL